jgi:hypothetical protein
MATNGKKIRVYELMPPSVYASNKDALQTILVGDGAKKNDIDFRVYDNGFVSFFNRSKLWRKSIGGKLPATAAEVVFILTNYIRVECTGRFQQVKKDFPFFPFPPDSILKMPPSISAAYDPATGDPDHLICWCYCSIYSNHNNEVLPVDGAVFEFRIGEEKTVIGLNIRWRPVIRIREETDFTEFSGPTPDKTIPPLIYLLESQFSPYLSPFFKVQEEENALFKTASRYSLELTILQQNKKNGASVFAQVTGGSGHYLYNWAYWRPDSVTTEGIRQLAGNLNELNIDTGVYNILLDVCDLKTGRPGMPQVRRYEQLIYALGDNGSNITPNATSLPIA